MNIDGLLISCFPALPAMRQEPNARRKICRLNQKAGIRIVVLDDDPTGCQTVHTTQVLTAWPPELLKRLLDQEACFYILANSRALPQAEAAQINREIALRLDKHLALESLRVVSRSDSTLRGHFPTETDISGQYRARKEIEK